jgi:type II secretory pathway pseudopilin PulG
MGPRPATRASRQSGFTYIAVLLAVALHGAVLAAVGVVWSNAQKRERETQLLFVGHEFRKAIRSYAAGAGGAGTYPESLEDLLRDPRTPALKRHLRKIYVDPMTGKAEWGLVRSPDGKGILGVYSLSEDAPLKTGNFAEADKEFEGKTRYAEWKFGIRPVQTPKAALPGAPGTPGAPPTAPGTLPGALQFPQQPPGAPQAAPQPAPATTEAPQPVPILQPTVVPPPAPGTAPPPAQESSIQPDAAAPPATAAEQPPVAAPPPSPAPAEPSPFTPGILTPIETSPVSPPPAPAPVAPAQATTPGTPPQQPVPGAAQPQ